MVEVTPGWVHPGTDHIASFAVRRSTSWSPGLTNVITHGSASVPEPVTFTSVIDVISVWSLVSTVAAAAS